MLQKNQRWRKTKGEKVLAPTICHVPQIIMMKIYDKDFPPLKSFHDQAGITLHQPKVLNPTTREPDAFTKKRSLLQKQS